jgi:hypothetical protein
MPQVGKLERREEKTRIENNVNSTRETPKKTRSISKPRTCNSQSPRPAKKTVLKLAERKKGRKNYNVPAE